MKETPPPSVRHHALEDVPDADAVRVEDALWWMRGRKAIIRALLRRAAERGPLSNIMDIGCGSGGNLDVLAEFGSVVGVEPSEILARRARNRGVAKAVLTRDALELEETRNADVFTLFDVLEHLEDDAGFLATLRARGGRPHRLLVSVPACPFLYGDHDRLLHHHRRYSARMLRDRLETAGYRVLRMSHFMFFLFPLALLARLKDQAAAAGGGGRTVVDLAALPPYLSKPFALSLELEGALSRFLRFPFGLWLFALAESPA